MHSHSNGTANNSEDGRIKTIMLVDDKEVSNFIMKKNISFYLPFAKAVEFTDPSEAFESIPGTSPDLIFLDLGLPMVEEGWAFLDKMQEQGYDHKVVILTSSISDEDYERSQIYPNVAAFISKPIFGEELIAIYNELDQHHQSTVHSA